MLRPVSTSLMSVLAWKKSKSRLSTLTTVRLLVSLFSRLSSKLSRSSNRSIFSFATLMSSSIMQITNTLGSCPMLFGDLWCLFSLSTYPIFREAWMVSGEGSQPFKFGGVWRDLEVSGERVGVGVRRGVGVGVWRGLDGVWRGEGLRENCGCRLLLLLFLHSSSYYSYFSSFSSYSSSSFFFFSRDPKSPKIQLVWANMLC